jgi:hypothetical protein
MYEALHQRTIKIEWVSPEDRDRILCPKRVLKYKQDGVFR